MDLRVKNLLGFTGVFALIVITLTSVMYVYTYNQSIEPPSSRSFSVSGEGRATVVPDVAQFTFEVITEGGVDLAQLQVANTEKVNAAIAYVKSQGVEVKDIRTQNYTVHPRYKNFVCSPKEAPLIHREVDIVLPGLGMRSCPPPEITGYTIRQTVSVKARDFKKAGNLLTGVVENGANSVSQLNFTVDDPTQVENEARAEAIAKAKDKANSLAEAGGFEVGRLLYINEGGYYPHEEPYYFDAVSSLDLAKGGGTSPTPTIEPGSQDIRVTVTLTYEIR